VRLVLIRIILGSLNALHLLAIFSCVTACPRTDNCRDSATPLLKYAITQRLIDSRLFLVCAPSRP
jgi:hypothetical protein